GCGADGLLLCLRARPARARRLGLLSYFFLQRGSDAWIAASCSSVSPRPLAPITNPHTRSWVGASRLWHAWQDPRAFATSRLPSAVVCVLPFDSTFDLTNYQSVPSGLNLRLRLIMAANGRTCRTVFTG